MSNKLDNQKQLRGMGFGEVPERVGPYTLMRIILKGGLSIVYEAIHDDYPEPIALKVFDGDRPEYNQRVDQKNTAIKRFHREWMTAACLHHPNIIPVLDSGSDGEQHYYAMKLINGLNLSELKQLLMEPNCLDATLSKLIGKFSSIDSLVQIAIQVLDALTYSHDQGIIHRDINPSNILVDSKGNAWVTDFGVAKSIDGIAESLTKTGISIGTRRYSSPEQICNNEQRCGVVDHRSDIYSVGLTFFELLTFGLPVVRSKTNAAANGLIRKIPKRLRRVLAQASDPDPANRFNSANEFKLALEATLQQPSLFQAFKQWVSDYRTNASS